MISLLGISVYKNHFKIYFIIFGIALSLFYFILCDIILQNMIQFYYEDYVCGSIWFTLLRPAIHLIPTLPKGHVSLV